MTGQVTGRQVSPALSGFGWVIWEWATQPYFLMVNIFVFAPYFSSRVIGDAVQGQALWGYIQAAAGLTIALCSPFLGALADAHGPRKPGIAIFTVTGGLAVSLLWFAVPGDPLVVPLVLGAVLVAALSFEFSAVYHNAMLPSLVSSKGMGRLSGLGYSVGYLGGVGMFFLWLGLFSLPEAPAFGLSKAAEEHNRVVGPAVALWLAVFILPFFFFTPDQPRTSHSATAAIREGTRRLVGTIRKLGQYRNVALYLIARMIYYDGMAAVFIFAGIYASGIFGWSTQQVGIYGLVIILTSAVMAVVGGWIDDHIGSRRTIMIFVALFGVAMVGILGISHDSIFYVVNLAPDVRDGGIGLLAAIGFKSIPEQVFLALGVMCGCCSGPALSSSRTLLARVAPEKRITEFFGLYALVGKATSFAAPLVIAIVTNITGSLRTGFSMVLIFIVIGWVLMLWVREERAEDAG